MPPPRSAASSQRGSQPSQTTAGRALALPSSISTEELREYFECPICLSPPRPGANIFACAQGHMICQICRPRVKSCPVCRITVTESNHLRLYTIERLFEDKVPSQCKFTELGCDVELLGQLLLQHERQCPFEQIKCDFNDRGCGQKVARAKKTDHLAACDYRLCECPIPECKTMVIHKHLMEHVKKFHFEVNHGQYLIHIFLVSLAINLILVFIMYYFML